MKTLWKIITFAAVLIIFTYESFSADQNGSKYKEETIDEIGIAKNAIYLDISTTLLTGTLSVNYDRVITDYLSIRTGIGVGYMFEGESTGGYFAVANFFNPGSYKFEGGFGLGYFSTSGYGPNDDGTTKIHPVITVGYRYQPEDVGLYFRSGLSYFGIGGGLHLGFGAAF